jgi:methyltransferase (TIGR00027 family)
MMFGFNASLVRVQTPTHSQTALTAAAARAAHLIVDGSPVIFADTLAERLLGDQAETLLSYHRNHGSHTVLSGARTQVTLRSRFAEARVRDGHARGIDQYVILGAGLDSFAYRNTDPGLRTFEVDHPASQQWKRDRVRDAGLAEPPTLTYVPLDFETQPLLDALVQAGFDRSAPAAVSWLGVTMYLTTAAIRSTLAELGTLTAGSEIVTDYMVPPELRDEAGAVYADLVSANSAERGEPWLSFFTPDDMTSALAAAGFTEVTHTWQRDFEPALWQRHDALAPTALAVLAHAHIA